MRTTLRELPALTDSDREAWAHRLQRLRRRSQRVVRSARERGIPLPRSLPERIGRRYDLLVGKALAYHEALPPGRASSPRLPAGSGAARG